MKRDLYSEVSARIVAELERGAAPWVKPWSTTPGQNVPQNAFFTACSKATKAADYLRGLAFAELAAIAA
jgi:antirestriction protein ArdC